MSQRTRKDRLPPIPPEQMSEAQRAAAAELARGPRGALFGPFVPLLRSPELMSHAQKLGAYLRYECSVPQRLRELAILTTARHWRQTYEWHAHASIAAEQGIAPAAIAALARGEAPAPLKDDERTVYAFCTALHRDHFVDDALYERAKVLLGEAGVVELSAICGYYAMLAMVMNVAGTPLPPDAQEPFPK